MALAIIVKIHVHEASINDAKEFFSELKGLILKSPGCTYCTLQQSTEIKNQFVFYEHWEDEASHDQYLNSDLLKGAKDKVAALVSAPIEDEQFLLV